MRKTSKACWLAMQESFLPVSEVKLVLRSSQYFLFRASIRQSLNTSKLKMSTNTTLKNCTSYRLLICPGTQMFQQGSISNPQPCWCSSFTARADLHHMWESTNKEQTLFQKGAVQMKLCFVPSLQVRNAFAHFYLPLPSCYFLTFQILTCSVRNAGGRPKA